ncbi:hypothetical protein FOZ62_018698, partial [Perkinsus olseni]
MTTLYGCAELRRVTSSILHYLDKRMRGMPEGCLVEVWAMAHPQVEGLERASRISISADLGSGYSALQGEILDVITFIRRRQLSSRIFDFDDTSLQLLLTDNDCHLAHTTQAYTYIMADGYHFYRIPRSTSFVRDLHNEECFSLRPWSAGDGQIRGIVFATSCDASFVYATTRDDLIEIDVEGDIGRYRTIQSRQLTDVSATILNERTTLFWLDRESPRNAYKWTRGDGGPGSKDNSVPFLGHCGVEFVALT